MLSAVRGHGEDDAGVEDMSDQGWRLCKLTRLADGAIRASFERVEAPSAVNLRVSSQRGDPDRRDGTS